MNDQLIDFNSIVGVAQVQASGNGLPYLAMIVVAVVVLFVLASLIVVARRFLSRPELHGMGREEIGRRWDEIERIGAGSVMGGKMAIVEADKLLDTALKSMAIPGETLGERLKFAGYRYPELKKVWFAHRLRNQLVHETSFELSHAQAKKALADYRHALKTINVL